jgi:hypothetical protein
LPRERPKTYGEELRSLPPEKLSRGERMQLRAEREWERANPQEVAALDALVGQRVALVAKSDGGTYATWAEGLSASERRIPGLPGMLIPTQLRAGLPFTIACRLGDRLLGIDAVGEPWILRREWLRVVHRVEAKSDDRSEEQPARPVQRRPRGLV